MNHLYYGDNLNVLREKITDESVDLIYLDPPFNSGKNYNVLFKSPTGEDSQAQIQAFEDTWHWSSESESFLEQLKLKNGDLAELLDLMVRQFGRNDLSAYLVMMAVRLVELHRVLKSTGSLYLHCDSTASHYLKIILDLIFGAKNFRNEIVWKRTGAHGGSKKWGRIHDTLLFYTKSVNYIWNKTYQPYDEEYLKKSYNLKDEKGHYQLVTLTGAGITKGDSGKPWRNVNPTDSGRHWALPKKLIESLVSSKANSLTTQEKLDILDKYGLIYFPRNGNIPRYKKYLSESLGNPIQDIILDISPVSSQAKEKLNYPTQKPISLLERIIQASSNPGDVILDPFCGCGTAVQAAQKLDRKWIGIDITHLAIAIIESRLKDAFPGIKCAEVHGTPKDLQGAKDLANRDKYQFQWWACSLVNAQPYKDKKKGADGGIDGQIFFTDSKKGKSVIKKIIVSVKGGKKVSLTMLKDLIATVQGNKAEIGLFITLASPTKPMLREAALCGFYKAGNGREYRRIQIITIEELLKGKCPEYFDMSMGE